MPNKFGTIPAQRHAHCNPRLCPKKFFTCMLTPAFRYPRKSATRWSRDQIAERACLAVSDQIPISPRLIVCRMVHQNDEGGCVGRERPCSLLDLGLGSLIFEKTEYPRDHSKQ